MTIALKDLLNLLSCISLERDCGCRLSISLRKLKLATVSDMEGIQSSQWIQEGILWKFSKDFGVKIKLEVRNGCARIEIIKGVTRMNLTILGET